MWRDRTNLYISYRQSYSHHPSKRRRFSADHDHGHGHGNGFAASQSEETRGLISASEAYEDGDAVIEMELLPPRWMDVQDEVDEMLKDMTLKSARLDKLHAQHVLPGFDDEHIKQAEEREIEALTQDITRGFQACQKAIKRIDGMADEVMAANIQMALAVRVQEVSATFRKKQSNYLSKLRHLGGFDNTNTNTSSSSSSSAATPVAIAQNPYSDPALLDSETDKSLSQAALRQQQQQKQQKQHSSNDTVIAQREREINDIAHGIVELADIFRDLQAMVIDQGTMLDRIDYNVERMATDVKGADKELVVASGYQRKTTKRKILLLLVLLVVGMIVLLVIKPKRRDGGGDSVPAPAPAPAPPNPP
ncbi:hypothetical protein DV735_g1769, partial [Chaetothyriales sp. CBS 134920]